MFLNPAAASWRCKSIIDPAIEEYHKQLPQYNETPLVSLPSLAKELGIGNIFIKDESSRFGLPAFKILGASWAIYRTLTARAGLLTTASLEEVGIRTREKGIK